MTGTRSKRVSSSNVQVVDLGDGQALLNVNQIVSLETALKVQERLRRLNRADDERRRDGRDRSARGVANRA